MLAPAYLQVETPKLLGRSPIEDFGDMDIAFPAVVIPGLLRQKFAQELADRA